MYTIMIIEDDPMIQKELELLLKNALYHTILPESFQNLPAQITEAQPDLVLMDINLPGENGLAVCQSLRKSSDVPVIFVTSRSTSMDELECITLGGDDYIAKPYNTPILLARISRLLRRTKPDTDENFARESTRLTYKEITLDLMSYTVSYQGRQTELSKNECRILWYLFRHPGRILPRPDIIEYLWDNQVFIDDNTLSVNMTRLRKKLEELGIKHLIETKRGLGYKI